MKLVRFLIESHFFLNKISLIEKILLLLEKQKGSSISR